MVDFICHVKPPAVYVKLLYPVNAHINQVFLQVSITGIKLWHLLDIGKSLITRRFLVLDWFRHTVKPVIILRTAALLHHILKGKKVRSTMIEYPIQQNSYAHLMTFFNQMLQIILASKAGVYLKIIYGVILVIGICLKYRI